MEIRDSVNIGREPQQVAGRMSGRPDSATSGRTSDGALPAPRPCRFCGALVAQPRRRGQVKEFCSDKHRAAFALQKRQDALKSAIEDLEVLEDEIDRLRATSRRIRATIRQALTGARRSPRSAS
jgi:hypothetical protein